MINRPPILQVYGGIDMHNRAWRCYNLTEKSVKWWKYLFWFFLDTAIINAFILYNRTPGNPKLSHLNFQLKLSQELIGNQKSQKRAGCHELNQCSWSHLWSDSWEGQKALPCNACKAKNFTQNMLTRKDLIPCKMYVFTYWALSMCNVGFDTICSAGCSF